MEAVMCLHQAACLDDALPVLRRHGAQVHALHPGRDDPGLALWYGVTAPDDSALRAVVAELQRHPAVDSAMLKPDGSPPG